MKQKTGKTPKQIASLLFIAFEESNDFIYSQIQKFIGAFSYMILFGFLFLMKFKEYAPDFASVKFDGAQQNAMTGFSVAFLNSYFESGRIIFFFLAALCIIGYAITFLKVLYIYDNKNWEIVKFLKELQGRFIVWRYSIINDIREKQEKYESELTERINAVRDLPSVKPAAPGATNIYPETGDDK